MKANKRIALIAIMIFPLWGSFLAMAAPAKITSAVLSDYFGQAAGDYIIPGKSLVKQFGEALSGPPNKDVDAGNGLTLISGCRYKSCIEKGAVAIKSDNTVEAAGLIHFNCKTNTQNSGASCSKDPTFTLFVPRSNKNLEAEISVLKWAHEYAPDATFETVTLEK
ncbi:MULTISPECIES: hypothetical protein [Xanthomonas]|uniref:hypothetical protein n=1 Tax=Xanthomonas TaxID=338 RepID=UPI0021B4A54C|nr:MULTISPECIES: hypothetical protein [Xanthomonas]MEA9562507.1 hypothetical protein [Xanthomonas campestris]MEA9725157.1 hypothetical protein [Xanthomonas campestris]MEB1886543.1 hypothetical protein [Xanthomonas campestris pv. campestris]UXA49270.1 hypothetical protein M0D44_01405 [Xanthomonas prunicola]